MRAVIHREFGDPAEVLEVYEVPTPEPGPGQVRVRTLLSPMHNHDLWTIRGTYGYKPSLPAQTGTEAVGVVDALGEGVTSLTVGQRVVTGGTLGVWAEYFVAQAAGLVPVSEDLPLEVAAQLVSMPFSALALLDFLQASDGDWIVQNAANGAVGKLVALLAAARGIHVVNLVRRDAGVEELAALGITGAVSTESPDWRERIDDIVGASTVVAAVDSVGGEATGQLTSILSEKGTLVVFGAMGSGVMDIPSGEVIFKQLTIRGFWGSPISAAMPAEKRAALTREIHQRAVAGQIPLTAEATYRFEEARDAAAASDTPGRKGKIMLRP